MRRSFQVYLILLNALHLVHCNSDGPSLPVSSPVFGIREDGSASKSRLLNDASTTNPAPDEQKPSLVRGGARSKFSTWSSQIVQPFGKKEGQLSFSMVKPGDGSEEDPDGIPKRYLIAHKDNRDKAKAALQKTIEWREEEKVNTILSEPQEKFDLCHETFPIFLPGRDSEGHLVLVQRPGKVKLDVANDNDISEDEILMHYIFIVEYIWNLLDPSPMPPDGLMTSIIDCRGVHINMCYNKQFRSFARKLVAIMSNHYPTRSHKTLIINAPKWIKLAFNLVKPLMRESTRKKVRILNSGPYQDKLLKELLGSGGSLPSYLSSEGTVTDDEEESSLSELEKELRLVAGVGLGKSASVAPWS